MSQTCEICGVQLPFTTRPKRDPTPIADARFFNHNWCEPCAQNDPKVKQQVMEWFNSRPHMVKNPELYNGLTFMPELVEYFQKDPTKAKPPYRLCPNCHEIGIETNTEPYVEKGNVYTNTYFLHLFITKQELEKNREDIQEFFDTFDQNGSIYEYFEYWAFLMIHRSNATSICLGYKSKMPIPRGHYANENAFIWTTCPKCGRLGEQIDKPVRNGIYRYVQHYNTCGDRTIRHYIRTILSGKNPTETCPICHKQGRRTVNKKGYAYIKHYHDGKRITHYVGK